MLSDQSNKMFGPLVFADNKNNHSEYLPETKCLLCEDSFNLSLSLPMFLAHIFDVHNVVIEDVQNIAKLNEYIDSSDRKQQLLLGNYFQICSLLAQQIQVLSS